MLFAVFLIYNTGLCEILPSFLRSIILPLPRLRYPLDTRAAAPRCLTILIIDQGPASIINIIKGCYVLLPNSTSSRKSMDASASA
jgi:hypothetical protein